MLPETLYFAAVAADFDFERPAFLFFTEYLASLGLFVWLGHDAAKGLQTMNVRKTQQKSTSNSTARQSE